MKLPSQPSNNTDDLLYPRRELVDIVNDDVNQVALRIESVRKISEHLSRYPSEFIRTIYAHIFNTFSDKICVIERMMNELDEEILVEMYNDLDFYDAQYLEELYMTLLISPPSLDNTNPIV